MNAEQAKEDAVVPSVLNASDKAFYSAATSYSPLLLTYNNINTHREWKLEFRLRPEPNILFNGDMPTVEELMELLSPINLPICMIEICLVAVGVAKKMSTKLATLRSNAKLGGEAMEWQPIETAPRNGTTILLRGKKAIADGWFGGLTGAGWVWPYIYAKPLYWMPLPEAPNRVPNV